jgi:nicotinamidase-related amidase
MAEPVAAPAEARNWRRLMEWCVFIGKNFSDRHSVYRKNGQTPRKGLWPEDGLLSDRQFLYAPLFMKVSNVFALLSVIAGINSFAQGGDESLRLNLRSRDKESGEVTQRSAEWKPSETVLIICDMWDDHWCKSAARRVAELAGPMNEMIRAARNKGVFILHAPSSTVDFYEDTPQRALARNAKFARTPKPLSTKERWGTCWCWPDPAFEGVLPIDDSDMGCSCPEPKCEIVPPWKRQIDRIDIEEGDAVTDNGQETWNLLAERGIENVILCGVHLNMCVLGRPFGIRQMVKMGKNVALVRDMTDTMYNPQRPPGVDHFTGTDLVVAHVEKYWCPSFTSDDITGGKPFRFREDREEKRE